MQRTGLVLACTSSTSESIYTDKHNSGIKCTDLHFEMQTQISVLTDQKK